MQAGDPRSLCGQSSEVDLKSLRAIRARSEAAPYLYPKPTRPAHGWLAEQNSRHRQALFLVVRT